MVDRLAKDLGTEFPGVEGFSLRNLRYMRSFAEARPDAKILQLAAKLPLGHHMVLLDRLKDGPSREWYLRASIEYGWSRNVLTHHISTRLQEREGKALTNFSRTLTASGGRKLLCMRGRGETGKVSPREVLAHGKPRDGDVPPLGESNS